MKEDATAPDLWTETRDEDSCMALRSLPTVERLDLARLQLPQDPPGTRNRSGPGAQRDLASTSPKSWRS